MCTSYCYLLRGCYFLICTWDYESTDYCLQCFTRFVCLLSPLIWEPYFAPCVYCFTDFNTCRRVLYEVFPMSFLMEQAGGQAFTGKQRVCSWPLGPSCYHRDLHVYCKDGRRGFCSMYLLYLDGLLWNVVWHTMQKGISHHLTTKLVELK